MRLAVPRGRKISSLSLLLRKTTVLASYYFATSAFFLETPCSSAWTTTAFSNNNRNRSMSCSSSSSSMSAAKAEAAKASSSSSTDASKNTASDASSSSSPSTTTTDFASMSFKESLTSRLENSWIRQLQAETPENLQKSLRQAGLLTEESSDSNQNNKTKRPVLNGHYVLVKPTGLSNPRLVLYSKDVAENLLGFTKEQIEESDSDNDFCRYVSGNLDSDDDRKIQTWATPYALSIMGTRYTNNCPYGTGDGYGDGRAITIGEIRNSSNESSWELQLKGAGTTPFHRGADGRAVLRSSLREFLASEAMHHLGVKTTRALSLIKSETDTIHRPWYREQQADNAGIFGGGNSSRNNDRITIPTMDDPRLARYDPEQRQEIINQIRRQQSKADPDVMMEEPAAITCRVATSFVRVGHLDLFARRAEKASQTGAVANKYRRFYTESPQWKELEAMIWHACYREYRDTAYTPQIVENKNIAEAATVLLQESAKSLATMVANWIRVGFAQGNFNADNCLVSGATMDYGPFGFVEEYDPLFAKWTGSGQHFGFLNQMSAGFANYGVLIESVVPVIAAQRSVTDQEGLESIQQEFYEKAQNVFREKIDETFRVKLGFAKDQDIGDEVWEKLEPLMRASRVDYTLLFRELTYLVRDVDGLLDSDDYDFDYEALLQKFIGDDKNRDGSSPFYEELTPALRERWLDWIEKWRDELALYNSNNDKATVYERMRTANPKYVLREWMLVDAYQGAAKGEEAELFALYDLIQRPYDEGSEHEEKRYYRRASEAALTSGGTAFMS